MTKAEAKRIRRALDHEAFGEIRGIVDRVLATASRRDRRVAARVLRAPGPTKQDRTEARAEAWAAAKVVAAARALWPGRPDRGPRCEFHDDRGTRCDGPGSDPDHLFGGSLRRETERHGAAALQVLCRQHHDLKTRNAPTRSFWLDQAEDHINRHGLEVMRPYLARARALYEGKRR